MAPRRKCQVCLDQAAKYKCPRCVTPYCSLACWKTHQQNPCSPPPAPNTTPGTAPPGTIARTAPPELGASEENLPERQYEVEGPESIDKVPAEKLARLGKSEALRSMLGNRHLRDILKNLRGQPDPVEDLEAAMHEPIFVEFAQECLNIVEGDKRNGESVGQEEECVL